MRLSARVQALLLRFVGVSALLIAALLLMGFPQCSIRGMCSADSSTLLNTARFRTEVDPAAPGTLFFWIDVLASGVYSPTMPWPGALGWLPRGDGVDPLPPLLDELAQKGYVAIRVPHAPPDYAPSSLAPGISANSAARAVEFTYYSPPDAAIGTTVPISVTRRPDYEAIVNARYPITDGRSHWEVWWVAESRFPVPEDTFRLKEEWPQALEVTFRIIFDEGISSTACVGCPVDVLFYNGYSFIGPWRRHIADTFQCPATNAPLEFDMCEGQFASVAQYIDSGVPFTHTHFLGNHETTERIYTITGSSSQGWPYTYYYGRDGEPLQRAAGLPFEVTIGAASGEVPCASCIGIYAVYTPTLSLDEPLRETFMLTATSKISPTLSANTVSMALGHGYRLDEASPTPTETEVPTATLTSTPTATPSATGTPTPTATSGGTRTYLPMVLHRFGPGQ